MLSIKKTWPSLFMVLLSWPLSDASAQNKALTDPWVSIGPSGGPLSELVQYPNDPSILFAMSSEYPSFLIGSKDKGRQWNILAKIPEYTQNLAIDPRNPHVLYTFAGSFFYKTDDGGLTWNSAYFEDSWFSDIVVHPSENGKLFACGTSYIGYAPVLLKSDDHGGHWNTFPITARNGHGSHLVVDPLHPDTIYVAGEFWDDGQPFLYRSFDGGSTWIDVGSALPAVVTDLAMDPVETNRIYASTYNGIFRSSDRGDTWLENTGFETTRITVDPNSRNILYAGQYQNILKSEDWGATWHEVDEKPDVQEIKDILVDLTSSDTVFCTTSTGFFQSSNAGENWQSSNSGFTHLNITAVKVSPLCPGTLLAAVYGNDVYKTTDATGKAVSNLAVPWERLPHFYACVNISDMEFDLSNPDIYYALEGGG